MQTTSADRQGFTLMEIALVLLIISMIVGGLSIAGDMIRGAEIQSVYGESARYVSAVKQFQDKYNALPGDFSTASGVFNSASNGDDDGFITGSEQFIAWSHLALAGMIEGKYTGLAGSAGASDRVPGDNIPQSQVSAAGWGIVYVSSASSELLYVTGDMLPNHVLWFGGRSTTGANNLQAGVLTTEEADQIDRKVDDGFPGTGKVVAQNNSGTDCHSSNTAYALSTAGLICALVFKTGY